MKPAVLVENHGSIVLLRPVTAAAAEWLRKNTDPSGTWVGGALACSFRSAAAIVEGLEADGFRAD